MWPDTEQSNHLCPCREALKLYIQKEAETQMDVSLPLQITCEELLPFWLLHLQFLYNSTKIKCHITGESSAAYSSDCCSDAALSLRQAAFSYLRDCLTCCRITCKCVVKPWSFNLQFLICSFARRRVITAVFTSVTIVNMI